MGATAKTLELGTLVEAALVAERLVGFLREAQRIVKETPGVAELAKAYSEGKAPSALPPRSDPLIFVAEAARLLRVSRERIYQYEKEGRIQSFYTVESSKKKFWLNDVRALAKAKGETA